MTAAAADLRFQLACMTERVVVLSQRLERRSLPASWCIYCGTPTHGQVCAEHEDLVALDPAVRP